MATYAAATKALRSGRTARRDLWVTWLAGSIPHWHFKTQALMDEFPNRRYNPTDIDVAATDWVIGDL